MADQIQWDEKPDTSGLSQSKVQWDEKPDTSELTADKEKPLIPENYGFTLENLEHSATEGVKNILGAGSEMVKDLISRKTPVLISDEPGTISERMQGNTLLNKYVLAPAKAEEQKAQTAKTPWESLGHSVAEAIPVIGPIAAHIGESAGTGDVGGALAEGATYAVAPKVAEKALPIMRGTRDFTRYFVKGAFDKAPVEPAPAAEPTEIPRVKAPGESLEEEYRSRETPLEPSTRMRYQAPVQPEPAAEPLAKYAPKAAEPVVPTATETAAPSLNRLEAELSKGLGNKPLKPGVPLREQNTAPAAETKAPRTQFEAANGKELDTAISKGFPDEQAAKDVRSNIHNLNNVELRQLAINLGEDLGQAAIGRAKQSGAITRPDIFKRLLKNNSAKEINQAIEDGKHLPSVKD
jgi:hypothetical protein